jgi:hypothetical protein
MLWQRFRPGPLEVARACDWGNHCPSSPVAILSRRSLRRSASLRGVQPAGRGLEVLVGRTEGVGGMDAADKPTWRYSRRHLA